MKKFFKKTEGFTLVELIVVIAILGILAGVGTVGYSGYIKKANLAADQQLLAALNQAFAAACIENGLDQKTITDADAPVTDKKVTTVDVKAGASDDVMAKIEAAFTRYFGTEGATFKVVDELEYTAQVGFYSNLLGGSVTVSLHGGGSITLSDAQVALLKKSTYAKDIGGLMTQVDEISGLVQGLLFDNAGQEAYPGATAALFGFMQSEDYLTSAIVAMGGTVASGTDLAGLQQQYANIVSTFKEEQAIKQVAQQLGISAEDVDIYGNTDHTNAYNALIDGVSAEVDKNILVLGVAQSAATQSKDGAMAIINSTDPKGDLLKAMTGQGSTDVAGGMGNAALVYGAFTAYASSSSATDAAKAALANSSDPTAVFDVLTGDELTAFQNYMKTEQGQTDMDACIAAMGVIDSTATDADAVNGALASGFANADFVAALEGLLK